MQFFGWLLVQRRIQSQANLARKNIIENASCELCGQEEDCDHIVFHCCFLSQVWRALGFHTEGVSVNCIWTVARSTTVPDRHFYTLLLLIYWMLWKQRIDLVFRQTQTCHSTFWHNCRDEARLWSQRFSQEDRLIADAWCFLFNSM